MSGLTTLPDYLINIGFNLVPGLTRITALGNNPDVTVAAIPEDVWTGGGIYPWMTAATALEIVSTDVNDTSAGTGARTVIVQGLDINYIEVSQTITLNGTTPVALPQNLFRINAALVMSAGSNKTNIGIINIQDAGAGTIRAILPAGYGITKQSIYTVPAGHTLQVLSQFFGFNEVAGGNKFARFATFVQSSNGFYRLPFELAVGDEPPYRHDGVPGLTLLEKTDFAIRCTAVSGTSNITAAWLGVRRRN